ncbi:ASCH domain-containing protein [Izhakiella australiensis]|uniref:ASCH domain-containing protein n=1 Tax=Izhakiella australiensis TaxID=1926881 RepID=A0A1S8YQQ0_9GAMM|nr:ASCH domain-containing protein [Izhakiella australiensis]OON41394.1 ASCH domain-containing protein [Izhakiella australiensis]
MTQTVEELKQLYPGAQAWAFGDSAELADTLASLVVRGIKTASCCSLACYQQDAPDDVKLGSYHIILDGREQPVCVIRMQSLGLIRFNDMSEALAAMEGEGDLSLAYWRKGHQDFFSREGTFSENMELVFQTFRVVQVVRAN